MSGALRNVLVCLFSVSVLKKCLNEENLDFLKFVFRTPVIGIGKK